MANCIEVNHLKKQYGRLEAVRDISFAVEEGALFSFLGPNGAGKSTTIHSLCTLLPFSGGEVAICGHRLGRDDRQIRQDIGVVFQENTLDELLTVKENLILRAGFYFSSRKEVCAAAEAASKMAGLEDVWKRPYGKLSGGQRRRADIARALLHRPKVLFLDEPTTGLDPQTRRNIWETIQGLRRQHGMTVFLTTHYMEEADKSDRVVVIDHGEVAAEGTPEALKETYASDLLTILPKSVPKLEETLKQTDCCWHLEGGRAVIRLPSTRDALPLLKLLGEEIQQFEVVQGTMDDAFIAITGEEIRA